MFRWRWWVPAYLHTLAFFCATFGTQPDVNAVAQFLVRRGAKITAERL